MEKLQTASFSEHFSEFNYLFYNLRYIDLLKSNTFGTPCIILENKFLHIQSEKGYGPNCHNYGEIRK